MSEEQIAAFLKANPEVARKAMEGAIGAATAEPGQSAATASSADVVPEWGATSSKPAAAAPAASGGGWTSMFGLGGKKDNNAAAADDGGAGGYAPPKVPAFTGSVAAAAATTSFSAPADDTNPFTNVPLGGGPASPRPASIAAAASPRPASIPAPPQLVAPKPAPAAPAEDFEDNPFAS